MTNIELIYCSVMEDIAMETESDNNTDYIDFSLNDLEGNPNDTIQELFHYEVEKAIDKGNINIIRNAIKDYGHLLDQSYISWANSISLQIVEEQIEEMEIK
tara:strand:- start:528 stop:830 length:303 start_codon:yes stop_codon:yes gene_type:complete